MKNILIVDDNPQNLYMLQTLLSGHGYGVVTAANGAEALEKARSERPDMIIADILMPVMDGFQLCREWKRDDQLKNIPFVFYTATYTGPQDEEFAIKIGADRFIRKPCEMDEFLKVVQNVIEKTANGKIPVGEKPIVEDEMEVYKLYNERLVKKLEQKMLALEAETHKRATAEKNLRNSHERLRRFIDANIVGVVIASPSGDVIEANDYYLRTIGYTREEFEQGMINWRAITPPEWLPADEHAIEELHERGICTPYEKEYVRRDGTRVSVYLADTMLPGLEEQIAAFVLDITERKRAEKILQESEERFRQMFDNMSNCVAIYEAKVNGEDFIFQDINCAAEQAEGVTRESVLGRSVLKVFPGVKEFGLFEVFQRVWKTGKPESHPVGLYKDNRISDWRENFVYKLSSGEVVAIYDDVTARKQAEEEVSRGAQEWRQTFDATNSAIWILDQDQRVLRSNMTAEKFFKRPQNEFIGKHCWKIVHGTAKPIPECPILRAKKSLRREIMELQIGDSWFEVTVDPILDAAGQYAGAVHILTDITARKENELFQEITIDILSILNNATGGLSETIKTLLRTLKEKTGFDAVGIRLRGGDDFPYFLQNGFSEDFVRKENYLCSFAPDGTLRRDETGRPVLECTCGLVLSGRADPMFTPGGSFWSNDTTPLLELPDEQDPRDYPRNQCIHAGYKSVALIPVRVGDEIVGLLQFNDRKTDCFTLKAMRFYEGIAASIGIALARQQREDALQQSEEKNRGLARENEILAGLGRIISSTLNIEEVYDRFAEEVKKLIPCDRIGITTIDLKRRKATIAYGSGYDVPGRRLGDSVPLTGTISEELNRRKSSILFQTDEEEEWVAHFPSLLSTFQARIRSMLAVPLLSKDQIIGALHLQSLKSNAYTEQDLRLAERIGNQIAGAIANAQLFAQHEQSEAEKVNLQAQLQQSQKMEAIGRLAGGVAHDFNNLLTVISVQSQLALRGLKEGDPLTERLKDIEQAADRAANLTRQLLAFSRRQILEMKVINLNIILEDMEKMLRRVIGEDIELKTIVADDLGMVKVDPGQMEQVIVNLVVNAKDAIPKGGKLLLETANAELDEEYTRSQVGMMPGAYVVLSITDTGIGMTREVKEQIFDPFFTTKEKGKGTGLGLSTVYGIVKQSGGDIYVYSEPDKGTTFKIYLPRVFEPPEEIKKATREKIFLGKETILVVEDDRMVRRLAVDILRRQGYRVLEAEAGGEALLISEQCKDPIDLILTDIVMPHMSGPEFIERLRQMRKDFKALYMTGYTDEAIVQQGIPEEGVELIHKPFTIEKLSRKVREVLDKN